MSSLDEILKQAIALKPIEKAKLIDRLMYSLDKPDADIDKLLADECESRIRAFERGDMKAVSLDEVLAKYRK